MKTPFLPFIRGYLKSRLAHRRFPSREALVTWQEKQVRRHLLWLSNHSPFYSKILKNSNVSNWCQLPVMTKAKMMENFDELNTASLKKNKILAFALANEKSREFDKEMGSITVGLSSGTSGNKGIFVITAKERAHWAGYILARMLPKPLWHKQRIALFLRSGGPLYQSTNGARIRFQYYDIFRSLDGHLSSLQKYQPTLLVAPPSVLRFLAEEKSANRLLLNPEKIVSVAEVLDPIDRIVIENAFGSSIHQVYQATEGCIASTCTHGTLHLHEDLMIIEKEFIDASRSRFVPIITDYSRTTQPIVRYRLDDILVEKSTSCPCGSIFTAFERIEGRCDDTLVLESKNSNNKVTIFPDFVRQSIVFSSNLIQEYRVTQTKLNHIQVEFSCLIKDRQTVEQQICHGLAKLFEAQKVKIPQMSFLIWQQKPLHQKMRRIHRECSIND